MEETINIDQPSEVVQNAIVIYDNVISPEQCDSLLKIVSDNCDYKKSSTYWDDMPDYIKKASKRDYTGYRISDQVNISLEPKLKDLDSFLFKLFNLGVNHYMEYMMETGVGSKKESGNALMINEDEGYALLKYSPGGKYDIHYDQAIHENKIKPIRVISSLLYLNGDFEGGETHFPYQDYKVKPKPGRLVFFPSTFTHPHSAIPVTEGTKYAIVTWFR